MDDQQRRLETKFYQRKKEDMGSDRYRSRSELAMEQNRKKTRDEKLPGVAEIYTDLYVMLNVKNYGLTEAGFKEKIDRDLSGVSRLVYSRLDSLIGSGSISKADGCLEVEGAGLDVLKKYGFKTESGSVVSLARIGKTCYGEKPTDLLRKVIVLFAGEGVLAKKAYDPSKCGSNAQREKRRPYVSSRSMGISKSAFPKFA